MAVEFQDTFTEASDTDLASHTPDTGTGWTVDENTTGGVPRVIAAEDICQLTIDTNSARVIVTADDTPSSADYDVEVVADDPAFDDNEFGIMARSTGGALATTEYYFFQWAVVPTTDVVLGKIINGTRTSLATADTDDIATGNTYKLEVRTDSQEAFIDSGGGYSSVASATNDDSADGLAGAGKGGMGWGNAFLAAGADARIRWDIDDFKITVASVPFPDEFLTRQFDPTQLRM